jgi:uncharacterized membrane protein YhaH (DUF805 family)
MSNLFTSDGRIPRSTYWKYIIVFYLVGAVMGWIGEKSGSDVLRVVMGLLFLPIALIGILVQIKRWHDRDKSGWWVLINLVPCIGFFWSLIELGFLKGTTGENRFGPDPLQ